MGIDLSFEHNLLSVDFAKLPHMHASQEYLSAIIPLAFALDVFTIADDNRHPLAIASARGCLFVQGEQRDTFLGRTQEGRQPVAFTGQRRQGVIDGTGQVAAGIIQFNR